MMTNIWCKLHRIHLFNVFISTFVISWLYLLISMNFTPSNWLHSVQIKSIRTPQYIQLGFLFTTYLAWSMIWYVFQECFYTLILWNNCTCFWRMSDGYLVFWCWKIHNFSFYRALCWSICSQTLWLNKAHGTTEWVLWTSGKCECQVLKCT